MDDAEYQYTLGSQVAWLSMLRICVRELGASLGADEQAAWVIERAETVAALRELCARVGDNEWDDSLHLADVIRKHLDNHLP
jgi:hypothetical protein